MTVKRYDRYFFAMFAQSLALVLALAVTVFLVVDVLLNLDKLQGFTDVARGATLFYAFNLPPMLYLLFPLLVAAAGLFTLARLIRSRELLLLQGSGVSPRRALLAILIPALLLSGLGLAARQFALPDLAEAARESPYGAFEFRRGRRISVRDDDGHVWFVRRYNLDTRTVESARILSRDGAQLAVVEELRWMEDGRRWWAPTPGRLYDLRALLDGTSDAATGPAAFEGELPFGNLFPADFARRRKSYSDRTLTELWREHAQTPRDRELGVALWHDLWHPFAGFLLLLAGFGIILTRSSRGMFLSGSLAIGCVIVYQLLTFWFETLARAGAFPPAAGASVTPLLFAALGLVLFSRA
jgi:lipopolysaccharide export LptBFGC system permease protein LptF